MRIENIPQLFRTINPCLFREKDLDKDVEELIVSWGREMHEDQALKIVVHLPEAPVSRPEARELDAAFRRYFDSRAQAISRDLRELFRIGRRALAIRLAVLSFSVIVSQTAAAYLMPLPIKELIAAVLEIKRLIRPRIAQQISHAFGLEIDKDVVRRILANHPLPKSGGTGPSWLSTIAEARDSLWSCDLFRCESILLKSFWVMVVMDVFTPRIVGFGVEPAAIRSRAEICGTRTLVRIVGLVSPVALRATRAIGGKHPPTTFHLEVLKGGHAGRYIDGQSEIEVFMGTQFPVPERNEQRAYPTHRCAHCTLMRCNGPDLACEECVARILEETRKHAP